MVPTNPEFQHADAWQVATFGCRSVHFGRTQPVPSLTARRSSVTVASSSSTGEISSLIRTQGIGDLAQIYLTAEHSGMGFNLARVPADFDLEPDELFDPEYMQALFERGVAAGRDENSWIRQGH